MPLKINQCFLHGFMTGGTATAPLTVVGDENTLTLRKGDGFDEWLKDTTKVITSEGETPYNEANIQVLNAIVRGWLYGMEYEG